MPRVLTDQEIAALLDEGKPLPANWQSRLRVRPKADQSFKQRELDVQGDNGRAFRLILRQSHLNPLDFSIVLTFVDGDGSDYRLIRLNGRHPSQHTNKWEKQRKLNNFAFRNRFHIHRATERYQVEGLEIDGYAEVTEDYNCFDAALELLTRSYGFTIPPSPGPGAPDLFEEQTGSRP